MGTELRGIAKQLKRDNMGNPKSDYSLKSGAIGHFDGEMKEILHIIACNP